MYTRITEERNNDEDPPEIFMDQRHSHGKHIYVEYVPVGSSQTEGGEEIVMDQRHSQKNIYVEYVPGDAWPKEGGGRNSRTIDIPMENMKSMSLYILNKRRIVGGIDISTDHMLMLNTSMLIYRGGKKETEKTDIFMGTRCTRGKRFDTKHVHACVCVCVCVRVCTCVCVGMCVCV